MLFDAWPGAKPTQLKAVRMVLLGLSVALIGWLGYAIGRGQSLAQIARLYRDETVNQYTLDTGQLVAQFARASGDLKPLLSTSDGVSLVDYSDWDYTSVVIVDGVRYELVRLVPSSSVDYGNKRIVEGLRSTDWQLSREITLSGNQATIKFGFLADKPVHDVRLTMAHVDWYYLSVSPSATGFVATVPHASRTEIETGEIRTPAYQVTVTAKPAGSPAPDVVTIGLNTPYGIETVDTQFHLANPPVGRVVSLGQEIVSYRKL